MTTSVLYSSTDAGAPQLNNTPGSLMAILTACLVNGFGGKNGLGWTMPFYDLAASIAVYRNDHTNGTGCFLRLHDDVPDFTAYGAYYLSMYSSMSSLDIGIDPIPLSRINRGIKTFVGGTSNFKWRLLGDSRGFYFIAWLYPGNPDLAYVFYCGDIISLVPGYTDMYGLFSNYAYNAHFATLVMSSNYTNLESTGIQDVSMINKNPFTLKFGGIQARLVTNFPFNNQTTDYFNLGILDCEIQGVNDVPFCSDVSVTISGPKIVGKLPGLEVPLYKYDAATIRDLVKERFFSVGGKLKMQVGLNRSGGVVYLYNPIILLTIGSGFRP